MEFKIWGKLDECGRIQSIQSNCSGGNHDFGSSLPYTCTDSNDKKKLVYKLDSKTDEMSMMILQMSDMTKRIQLQEKLLAEYEDKFKRQQREIELLRRENNVLRSQCGSGKGPVPETPDTNPFSSSHPVTTFEMTCNLKCKPFKHHSCPTMSTNNLVESDVFSSSGSESSRQSCSTCATPEGSSESEQRSLDNVDGFAWDNRKRMENTSQENLLDPADSNERVSFEVSDVCSNQTDESKLIEGLDGYILAANYDKVVNQFKDEPIDAFSRSQNTDDNNLQDTKSDDCEINAEFANMRERQTSGMCSPTPHSTPSSCRSSLSIDTDKNGYLILDKPAPLVREICHEEIHGTWLSVNLKIQQSQNGTVNDQVDGHTMPQRPTSIGADFMVGESGGVTHASHRTAPKHNLRPSHHYVEIDESKLDRDFHPEGSSETPSLYIPRQAIARTVSEAYCEDDGCNAAIKTMRTTMEWAKAKKGLLKESNDMTVEKVEGLLRDSVKEIYTTLKHYESSKPYRMNKPVADKALAVQRHLRHSTIVDVISDDFLRKCVMVCSSKAS